MIDDLLIKPEEISVLSRPCYVDEDKARSYILESELNNVKPAIGDDMYLRLKDGMDPLLLNGGVYRHEGQKYNLAGIKRALAYYVYSRLTESSSLELTRQGVVVRRSEYSDESDRQERIAASRETYAIADRYMEECLDYISRMHGGCKFKDVNNSRVKIRIIGDKNIQKRIGREVRSQQGGGLSPEEVRELLNDYYTKQEVDDIFATLDGWKYVGIATMQTEPMAISESSKVYYIAVEAGDYNSFGLDVDMLSIIKSDNGQWVVESLNVPFDIDMSGIHEELSNKADKEDVPTKMSELINDEKFVNETEVDNIFVKKAMQSTASETESGKFLLVKANNNSASPEVATAFPLVKIAHFSSNPTADNAGKYVYADGNGKIQISNATYGESTPELIKLSNGRFGKSIANLGSTKEPVFLENGVFKKATEVETKDSVNSKLEAYEKTTDAEIKLQEAKDYADRQITALVDSAPEAMNTLRELAEEIAENEDVYEAYIAEHAAAMDQMKRDLQEEIDTDVKVEKDRAENVETALSARITVIESFITDQHSKDQNQNDRITALEDILDGDNSVYVKIEELSQSLSEETIVRIQGDADTLEAAKNDAKAKVDAEATIARAAEEELRFSLQEEIAERQSDDRLNLQEAKSYTDVKVANLVGTAPETLDTLQELAEVINKNDSVVNALNAAIGNKVDKIEGKGLSTNDFTNEYRLKLDSVENYDDSAIREQMELIEQRQDSLQTSQSEIDNDIESLNTEVGNLKENKADKTEIPIIVYAANENEVPEDRDLRFVYLVGNEEKKIINFYVDEGTIHTYQAEEGMTWSEYVQSDFKHEDFNIIYEYGQVMHKYYPLKTRDYAMVNMDDVIISEHTYLNGYYWGGSN